MNYSRFLSEISKSRQPSPLRVFSKYLANPSPTLINMSAGYPNPETFPYENARVTLKDGSSIDLDGDRMKLALQYSVSQGLPEFLKWLKELQKRIHKPPTLCVPEGEGQMDILVTPGSQDAIVKSLEALLNPGDSILLEEPTYPGSLAFMKPMKLKFKRVFGDGDGMNPESLKEVLSRWTPEECRTSISPDIPRVLYLIPTAGNPTGTTISDKRRAEIYRIAQEYDLMIIEDDPYYFLNFGHKLPSSFLSLDVDGRVIRTDSFSKILSSGMRVGFVSGPNPVIERIMLHMQSTICHTSGLSQIFMLSLLEKWGHDGFLNHVSKVQQFYKKRRDMTIQYAEKWLSGLAEWNVPSGGMFLWITVPKLKDTSKLVTENLVSKELIIAPGNVFMSDSSAPTQNLRVSFSFAREDHIDSGFQRLAKAIEEEISSS